MRTIMLLLVSILVVTAVPAAAADQKITAGVAANFINPFNEIAGLFEKETGIHVEIVFTSSGKLYAQIINGAPYDVFLSADEARPTKLFNDGLAEKPFVYARGQIVLWAADKGFCAGFRDWGEAVQSDRVKKIAVANPESAPYGAVSMVALKAAGLEETVKVKLVFPQDIGQAFQYASTGSVDVGFCAMSYAVSQDGQKGCYLTVEQAPQVVQAACILTRTPNREMTERFAGFLLTPAAIQVKEKYGYR